LTLFVDGEKQYASIIQAVPSKNDESLWIGCSSILKGRGLDGTLDEVRLFRRALAEDEIEALSSSDPDGASRLATRDP